MAKVLTKNMVAQQFKLTASFIDAMDVDIQDKTSKLVLSEWVNILSKATTAFLSDDDDEIESCKDDMRDSFNVIKELARLTPNEFAYELANSYIGEWIEQMENFKLHESIMSYVDTADVIIHSWKRVLPA